MSKSILCHKTVTLVYRMTIKDGKNIETLRNKNLATIKGYTFKVSVILHLSVSGLYEYGPCIRDEVQG